MFLLRRMRFKGQSEEVEGFSRILPVVEHPNNTLATSSYKAFKNSRLEMAIPVPNSKFSIDYHLEPILTNKTCQSMISG